MKDIILKTVSYLALAGTIAPSILVYNGIMDLQVNKTIMGISMLLWFITAPLWINKKSEEAVK